MRLGAWRLAIAAAVLAWAGVVSTQPAGPVSLEQGWTAEQRTWFYTTTQGSRLLPYSWYLALEQPGGGAPFNADHLSRYGYLENRASNPDNLPLGFVKDLDQDHLGLTCSACHTNEVTFAGRTWRIDGAPTDADTWAFLRDLGTTLQETAASQSGERYKRFAAKVTARTRASEGALYADLRKFSEYFTRFVDSSRAPDPWGRARLDAFGMIFNRATGIDLNDWSNTAPPNAPVSVPFLWDTHWHDVVQWNGSAPNILAFQRLGRNVGEVLGVFAAVDVKKQALLTHFQTSARRLNLLKIEHQLASLRSPRWPQRARRHRSESGAPGAGAVCHLLRELSRDQSARRRMTVSTMPIAAIGTDPMMATNAKNRMAKSGILEGARVPALSRTPIPADLPSVGLTLKVAVGAILAPPSLRQIREEVAATRIVCSRSSRPIRTRTRKSRATGCAARFSGWRPARIGRPARAAAPGEDAQAGIQVAPARRHLGHGALSAQRIGAEPGRAAQAREPAAVEVLRRHALLRSQERRLHHASDAGRLRVRHVEAGQPQHRARSRTVRAAAASRTSSPMPSAGRSSST
jgi:hypothetical protein